MIVIKNERDLARMRVSCRVAAEVRDAVAARVVPGVTTQELETFAAEQMRMRGAKSAFLGYRGFPGQMCISLNEVVVHGIASRRPVALGDIVSLDIGVIVDGYCGDTACTVMVGVVDPDVIRLVRTTEAALAAALAVVRPGNRVGDISHAVEQVAMAAGYGVVRQFVGHGIGRKLHEDPQVPNFGPPGKGPKLRAGMTLAIEPMINQGTGDVEVLEDGWTVVTRDGRWSSHCEHTVAVTPDGMEILTLAA